MDSRKKGSPEAAFNKVKEDSKSFGKKIETFFMLFVMFLIAAICLWFGTHKYFGFFTASWSADESMKGQNIKDMWNVLMYFGPFLLFSLSMGCLAVYMVFGLLNSLSFALDFVLFKWKRNNNGGGKDEN